MRTAISVIVLGSILIASTASHAATNEEKCLARRADAAAKYLRCTQKWISKCYGTSGLVCDDAALSKCRTKYGAVWPLLQTLTGTVCAQPRWVDNGTTVIDNLTGLIWEKKTDDDSEHDWDNSYTWTDLDADVDAEDGTVFTVFLPNLNAGSGFAGANGWRLPSLAELQTILLPEDYPCGPNPCIDPVFGPTQAYVYWSSTTSAWVQHGAWGVYFNLGSVNDNHKQFGARARAVRGGL